MLLSSLKLDSKTIRQALVAYTLMERYLQHFEDNYRELYEQAARQVKRDNAAANEVSGGGAGAKSHSPHK